MKAILSVVVYLVLLLAFGFVTAMTRPRAGCEQDGPDDDQ